MRNDELEGFSVERLMTLLTALDQDIEIVIRQNAAPARGGAHQRGGGVRGS